MKNDNSFDPQELGTILKGKKDINGMRQLLNIINTDTSEQEIYNKKQEAFNFFNNKIKDNPTSDVIIQSLQETIEQFYPKNNDSLLQSCLVGEIESNKECNTFDDSMVGLVYGLGVCRHMAKLVNYLIKQLKLENIQACSIDNGGHAWNYLRFKNNNNYTYYEVDTYKGTSKIIEPTKYN